MKLDKATLVTTLAVSLAIANVTAAKLAYFDVPFVGGVAVPAGFVGIGVAFLCTDLLGELYGKADARSAVNGTIVALVVAYALIYVAISMPVAPFYGAHSAYTTTLGASANVVLASILTLLVSQNVDVSVFHRLKAYTDGSHRWLRNVGSTTISQFVDTVLFITLAFGVFPRLFGGEPTAWAVIPSLIVGQYVVKLALVGLDTPLFYLGTWLSSEDSNPSSTETVVE